MDGAFPIQVGNIHTSSNAPTFHAHTHNRACPSITHISVWWRAGHPSHCGLNACLGHMHGSHACVLNMQELCNGGSLRSALRRGILAPGSMQPRWPSVLRILCGVAAGMDHMHTLRVYHGALSPSNILFKAVSYTHLTLPTTAYV